jgi:hypothetical protein
MYASSVYHPLLTKTQTSVFMNLGSYSRVTFGIAAFILIVSGYNDLALQSAASSSWDSESSLLVINVRSRGMLKIALGLGALGLTLLGVGVPD